MLRPRDVVKDLPLAVGVGACLGGLLLGAVGAVTGLVLGLHAYPPTAWFAVFEVGVPAAFVGCALGSLAGLVAHFGWRTLRG
ncbi:hypothetical protein [Marmoricola sp. RAF53]|uniref:hypothetical protein n=1 Tax=Marmoricola sp. RAF53 TaxID=3233059 RepID=UPI003F962E4D